MASIGILARGYDGALAQAAPTTVQRGQQHEGGYGILDQAAGAAESLSIISRRAVQLSLLADAIDTAGEHTLAELALQLHAPATKLRSWSVHWKNLAGQHRNDGAHTAAGRLEPMGRYVPARTVQ